MEARAAAQGQPTHARRHTWIPPPSTSSPRPPSSPEPPRRPQDFEFGWKTVTKRPIPAEDSDDVTLASLVLFAASTAAVAAVAQRYAYKGSQKYLAPKIIARFGAPQIEA